MKLREVEDPVLGTLSWDAELGGWTAPVPLSPNHGVELTLFPAPEAGPPDVDALAAVAREALVRVAAHEADLRRWAANELHEDATQDFDATLSVAQLADRLRLHGVTCYGDGACELWYDDGGVFDGHGVLVAVAADGQPEDATIEA